MENNLHLKSTDTFNEDFVERYLANHKELYEELEHINATFTLYKETEKYLEVFDEKRLASEHQLMLSYGKTIAHYLPIALYRFSLDYGKDIYNLKSFKNDVTNNIKDPLFAQDLKQKLKPLTDYDKTACAKKLDYTRNKYSAHRIKGHFESKYDEELFNVKEVDEFIACLNAIFNLLSFDGVQRNFKDFVFRLDFQERAVEMISDSMETVANKLLNL